MSRQRAPQEVLDLAHARRDARAERDWPRADELRAAIEAAGWKVLDRGVDFELTPAHPPDLEEGGRVRYGSSSSVPSRLAEEVAARASIVLVATDWATDVERALQSLAATPEVGVQTLIVANAPAEEVAALLDRLGSPTPEREVVWTSARLGHAAALNAGIRRSVGERIVLFDSSVEPQAEFLGRLLEPLADPDVGVSGPWGLRTTDLRHFEETTTGEVAAIEGYCQAFRRADFIERGPLDEHFRFYRNLDIWWSLVLRDQGENGAPRRAVVVPDLPLDRHEHREYSSMPSADRDRLSKRNFYRVIDRFGARRDLVPDASQD
jgi:hypothetical protein